MLRLSALGIDFVKLHSLYIEKDTIMGQQYEKGEIQLITKDEYIDRVILFLNIYRQILLYKD